MKTKVICSRLFKLLATCRAPYRALLWYFGYLPRPVPSFALVLGLLVPVLASAQTFRLAQLPATGSTVTFTATNQPAVTYILFAEGDRLTFTRLRWSIFPLWPLTTNDVEAVALSGLRGMVDGTGSFTAATDPSGLPALAFTLTPANATIPPGGSETFAFALQAKTGRPTGTIVVGLEEIVAVGATTKTVVGWIDGDHYSVAIRFPDTQLALAVSPGKIAPKEPNKEILLHWSAEPGKQYRIESTTDLARWTPETGTVVGAGSEIRFIAVISPFVPAKFFRIAVLSDTGASISSPQPPPSAGTNAGPYKLKYPRPRLRW